jgi:hypothetical protein
MGNPNWVKGQSGNPAGRPKRFDVAAQMVRELLEKDDSANMKRVLNAMLASAVEDRNYKAGVALMERGYGKTVTQIEVIAPEMSVSDLVTGIMNGRDNDGDATQGAGGDAEQS